MLLSTAVPKFSFVVKGCLGNGGGSSLQAPTLQRGEFDGELGEFEKAGSFWRNPQIDALQMLDSKRCEPSRSNMTRCHLTFRVVAGTQTTNPSFIFPKLKGSQPK